MSPSTIIEPRPLAGHPQRPWRSVETPPRRALRTTARAFSAPTVRELPPRRARREPLGTW
jgi:hypothetical protein